MTMHSGAKRSLLVAIIIAVALTPLLSWIVKNHSSNYFNGYYLGVLIDIAINIILAVSLNLINGHTGQFSLGHAGFMAVGGYTAAKLTLVLHTSVPAWAQPMLFTGALLLGGIAAAVVGLGVGVPSLRLRGDYLAIVTLGFGEIIRVIFQTTSFFGAATGLPGIPNWTNFGWAWSLAAVTVFVVACLVNSTYGRGFIATHDDEVAASAMGINPVRYKVTAFVIGAFFAGIAGGLFAHHKRFLSPTSFDFMKSIDIVVMVILGGMGRTPGVIAAAVILTILPEALRTFADFRMILYSLLIIGLMILRPQGLFSWKRPMRSQALAWAIGSSGGCFIVCFLGLIVVQITGSVAVATRMDFKGLLLAVVGMLGVSIVVGVATWICVRRFGVREKVQVSPA